MEAVTPKISANPNSYEKFISFSIGDIKFCDSMKFLGTSLEKLVKNLYSDDINDKYKYFNFMKKEYPRHYELLCQKGYYPYDWFDDTEKFSHLGLPSRHHFYSRLKREDITVKEYEHATKVYINRLNVRVLEIII